MNRIKNKSSKALLGVFAGRRAGGETGGTAGPAGIAGAEGMAGIDGACPPGTPLAKGGALEGGVEIAGGGSACAAPGPMTTRVNSLGPGGTGLRGCIGGPGSLRGDTSGSDANAGWPGGDTRAGLLVPNSCVYSPAPAGAPGEEGRSVPPSKMRVNSPAVPEGPAARGWRKDSTGVEVTEYGGAATAGGIGRAPWPEKSWVNSPGD